LQLLVIKRLQADHLPIRKIKELVEGKSEHELEQLLNIESEKPKNAAIEYLESLLNSSQKPAPRLPPSRRARPAEQPSGPASVNAWSRVEVEPGLELHIREDYRLPDDLKERQRLARRMLSEIENH
jgi:DNA-binding transcriptional MerR regulator